ncbi:MAG: hypothetical protein R3C59_03420 [Planctomycetaceae bacterium]
MARLPVEHSEQRSYGSLSSIQSVRLSGMSKMVRRQSDLLCGISRTPEQLRMIVKRSPMDPKKGLPFSDNPYLDSARFTEKQGFGNPKRQRGNYRNMFPRSRFGLQDVRTRR